jgi:hypothetical protein
VTEIPDLTLRATLDRCVLAESWGSPDDDALWKSLKKKYENQL